MRIKRELINILFVLKNIWNKLHLLSVIPFFIFFVVLNIWNVNDYIHTNEYSKYFMNERMLMLIPVGISVMLLLLLSEYLSGCGREFFYLNRRTIIIECVTETILYSVLMSIEYALVYRRIVGAGLEIYLKYLFYIVGVSGLTIFLCYRIRKINIVIMLLVLVYLAEVVTVMTGFFGGFCISSWNYYDVSYMPMILIMLIIGMLGWWDACKQISLYSAYDD